MLLQGRVGVLAIRDEDLSCGMLQQMLLVLPGYQVAIKPIQRELEPYPPFSLTWPGVLQQVRSIDGSRYEELARTISEKKSLSTPRAASWLRASR